MRRDRKTFDDSFIRTLRLILQVNGDSLDRYRQHLLEEMKHGRPGSDTQSAHSAILQGLRDVKYLNVLTEIEVHLAGYSSLERNGARSSRERIWRQEHPTLHRNDFPIHGLANWLHAVLRGEEPKDIDLSLIGELPPEKIHVIIHGWTATLRDIEEYRAELESREVSPQGGSDLYETSVSLLGMKLIRPLITRSLQPLYERLLSSESIPLDNRSTAHSVLEQEPAQDIQDYLEGLRQRQERALNVLKSADRLDDPSSRDTTATDESFSNPKAQLELDSRELLKGLDTILQVFDPDVMKTVAIYQEGSRCVFELPGMKCWTPADGSWPQGVRVTAGVLLYLQKYLADESPSDSILMQLMDGKLVFPHYKTSIYRWIENGKPPIYLNLWASRKDRWRVLLSQGKETIEESGLEKHVEPLEETLEEIQQAIEKELDNRVVHRRDVEEMIAHTLDRDVPIETREERWKEQTRMRFRLSARGLGPPPL